MKKLFLAALPFLVLAFNACKKKDPEPTPNSDNPSYEIPNKAGSYFIYQWHIINADGTESATNLHDTIKVMGDTTINGKIYVKLNSMMLGSPYFMEYIRKENGKVMNSDNSIRYSFSDYTSEFNHRSEDDFEFYTKMYQNTNPTTVAAGVFPTIEARTHYSHPNGQAINTCGDLETTSSVYYTTGIGEIKQSIMLYSEFTQECKKRERRLVSYFIPN